MPDFYKGKIPIITRDLDEGYIRSGDVTEVAFTGCVERDYSIDPEPLGGATDSPSTMTLIPESEDDARFDEEEKNESSMEHLFLRGDKPAFDFLDQNRFPDCWAHSIGHCYMFDQLKQNIPVVRVNAVAVATMMNRTNGGWSGGAMKFGRDNGYPIMGSGPGEWPQWTRDKRYDTPELRAKMKQLRVDESWYDMGKAVYDQVLTRRQLATCCFNNIPCATDWNRFGHAMCTIRRVRIERGFWGWLTLNSHKQWGYFGLGVFANMDPNNAVGLRSSTPFVR